MAKLMYDIKVVIGKYTNKDGEEKNRYLKMGAVIETKNGLMMKWDCIPVVEGGWNGYAYLNPPEDQENSNKPRRRTNDFDTPF